MKRLLKVERGHISKNNTGVYQIYWGVSKTIRLKLNRESGKDINLVANSDGNGQWWLSWVGKKEENWGRYFGFSIFFRKRFVFMFDKKLIGYSWVCQRFHVVFTI